MIYFNEIINYNVASYAFIFFTILCNFFTLANRVLSILILLLIIKSRNTFLQPPKYYIICVCAVFVRHKSDKSN